MLRNQLDVRNSEAYNLFKFVRKLREPLRFQTKVFGFFVAAGMAFSVFFFLLFRR